MGQGVQFQLERWRQDGQDGREEEGRKEKAGGKENHIWVCLDVQFSITIPVTRCLNNQATALCTLFWNPGEQVAFLLRMGESKHFVGQAVFCNQILLHGIFTTVPCLYGPPFVPTCFCPVLKKKDLPLLAFIP